jgi:Fe-S-cluster containining protein
MVVYLGFTDRKPKRVNPSDEKLLGKPEVKSHRYRCKHFDPKKKICTIYEIRPQMCRDYPGGKGCKCQYAACTWTKRKEKQQTKKELADRKRKLTAQIESCNASAEEKGKTE